MAGRWERRFAGFYKRIAADGVTEIASVSRDDDGTWSFMVTPFGRPQLGWQVTGYRTLAEAQTMAAAGYRSYMNNHRKINQKV